VSTLDLMDQAETGRNRAYRGRGPDGGANIARLAEQARRWKPKLAVIADAALKDELDARLAGSGIDRRR
jgi:1-deoxy-D-xylulose-5-phosphate reductoisomerase